MQDDLPDDVEPEPDPIVLRRRPTDLSALFIDRQEDFALKGDEPDVDHAAAFAATHRHLVGIDPSLITPMTRFCWGAFGDIVEPPLGPVEINYSGPWIDRYKTRSPEIDPDTLTGGTDWFGPLPLWDPPGQ